MTERHSRNQLARQHGTRGHSGGLARCVAVTHDDDRRAQRFPLGEVAEGTTRRRPPVTHRDFDRIVRLDDLVELRKQLRSILLDENETSADIH